jgi:hypothetical protein
MPDVLARLASALGRNDERPNVELAEDLAKTGDKAAIAVLAKTLGEGPLALQNDAIKVLYEIGVLNPGLVAPYADTFLALLESKNNRNVWGALQAIDTIVLEQSAEVLAALPAILAAADKGSVIERVAGAAPNQFPMYAELAAPVIDTIHKAQFIAVLEARLKSIDAPAKQKRVEKVLRSLGKSSR